MEAKDYWSYWITIVQELRVRVDTLEKRVAQLESKPAPRTPLQTPAPGQGQLSSMADLAKSGVSASADLDEKELAACIALKELGKPVTVDEVNEHLKKTRKIDESMKETLFLRLKGAMEKGYVGFDSKNKKFILLKQDFMVG